MKKGLLLLLMLSGYSLTANADEAGFFSYLKLWPSDPLGSATTAQPDLRIQAAKQQDEAFVDAIIRQTRAPRLGSAIALIYDEQGGRAIYSKNVSTVAPIASITKLMTAMVVLDANLPMDEPISITDQDTDHKKGSKSHMRPGMTLTRAELLKLALMASENRAAAALARSYPGGTQAALAQMNAKAEQLGMRSTRFYDPTGLNSNNVSTANDLVAMVTAANKYEQIRQYTTSSSHTVQVYDRRLRSLRFVNTNPLVRSRSWEINLSKTGYISEAGRCLVMEATISQRPVVIVLLDSWGKHTRVGDANRLKKWMENASAKAARSNSRIAS
jgi:D-alanyl-D-alanine endopeptidase (penicillin-binding protein 7)